MRHFPSLDTDKEFLTTLSAVHTKVTLLPSNNRRVVGFSTLTTIFSRFAEKKRYHFDIKYANRIEFPSTHAPD